MDKGVWLIEVALYSGGSHSGSMDSVIYMYGFRVDNAHNKSEAIQITIPECNRGTSYSPGQEWKTSCNYILSTTINPTAE